MSYSEIYWLITIPKIGEAIGAGFMVFGIIMLGIAAIIAMASHDNGEFNEGWKYTKRFLTAGFISLAFSGMLVAFVPTRKEMLAIVGISKVTSNEELNKIPNKLFELANITLDDLIEEED